MDFNDIVKQAKDVLVRTHDHIPQAIVEGKDGISIVAMAMRSHADMPRAIEWLRQFVQQVHSERYFVILLAWYTDRNPSTGDFVLPRNDPNRKEALIVQEFVKGNKGTYGRFPFERQKGKIVFLEDEDIIEGGLVTLWNVFFEKEGIEEHIRGLVAKNQKV